MRKKLSIFLIIVGLLMIIIPQGLRYYSKYVENNSIDKFKQEIKQAEVKQTYEPGEEIAIMRVNSVGLETVIVEGTDNKYLKYYACHFEGTAMPGEEGNFSVAGHSSYLYNQVFNELHKVKINDEIEIETTKGIFKYKITEKFDTEAENTFVLDQDTSKKEITLVTCTDGGKKRLIIKGEIEE